jgi:hypothetical protein
MGPHGFLLAGFGAQHKEFSRPRQVQLLHFRVAIPTQEIAFCGFCSQDLVRAIPGIEGGCFAGRMAVRSTTMAVASSMTRPSEGAAST